MIEKSPLVSVIINCLNGEKFLRLAIDSIYAQSYKNWEIIFWDNASTDSSPLIAKSYDEKLKYFRAQKTVPLGLARNLALGKVSGKYVSFLDCDDEYLPDKIQIQVNNMQSSNAILSYGSWIEIDNSGEYVKKHQIQEYHGDCFARLLNRYNVNFQTVMINKELLSDGLLSFDEKLSFSPDFKLVMQIAYFHSNLLAMSEYLSKYRVHSENYSKYHKKVKITEFESTMKSLKEINIDHNKVRHFNLLEKIFKYRMKFRDSLEDKKYPKMCLYAIWLLFLYINKFFKGNV